MANPFKVSKNTTKTFITNDTGFVSAFDKPVKPVNAKAVK